ncbi:MAG: hypothetical protein JKY54_15170 [Flavobacteriales bacterium]|nr:hypothetical protein [Flavobacteriales bacterium]
MSSYDFKNLSFADFEDLSLDLIGKEMGIRFEAFAAGPDGGMDGRHSIGEGLTILQAKHYANSSFATLKNRMKREKEAVDKLRPARYILVVSHALTPNKKKKLVEVLGTELITESDIFGPNDLNALLRDYPEIEKAHIKLWLSSAGVLERIIRSASHAYNDITLGEIEAKLTVYVQNPSLDQGQKTLEKNHILIISGPPGVGKTTLAEILAFAYVSEGWELKAIRCLDDGFSEIDDTQKQVFIFDDFLGRVALDRHALSQKDSDLYKFLNRVSKSKNARFILTTRAYILEEARRSSEYLSGRLIDISKYVLDVGIYTRRIKARILYNHFVLAKTPREYISTLVQSKALKEIVDHDNYNPRIVEWMTDEARYGAIASEEYPEYFINALNNPQRLWDTAFRDHLTKKCQHLLFSLFFCSEYGVFLDDLMPVYNSLHARLSQKYGTSYGAKDFEESVKILEGSFISITNKEVRFINPSIKDYLSEYLNDFALISEFPRCAERTDWANNLWLFGKEIASRNKEGLEKYAFSFRNVAEKFLELPIWKRIETSAGFNFRITGLFGAARIILLLDWWSVTKRREFENYALSLAENPIESLSPWRDGCEVVELIYKLRDGNYFEGLSLSHEIADQLEISFLNMLEFHIDSDDLERLSDAIDCWGKYLCDDIKEVFTKVVHREFDEMDEIVSAIDSDSTLHDYVGILKKLGERNGLASEDVDKAIEIVHSRIVEIQEEETSDANPPELSIDQSDSDKFDDEALVCLFRPLLDVE